MNRRLSAEIWIVLLLSLLQSAIYSIVSLIAIHTRGPLRDATVGLNQPRSDRGWLDLTYQLLSIGFALVPVALVLLFLGYRRLGLRWRPTDPAWAVALAAGIGIPGLALYFVGRELGVTANIVLAPDNPHWWTYPLLILSALQNSVLEELIVVGYLMTRLKELRWNIWPIIAVSAVLRGAYHLYQGFGQAFGNVIMGVVFAFWFHKTGRLWPLVIAHFIMDLVVFIGYGFVADAWGLR